MTKQNPNEHPDKDKGGEPTIRCQDCNEVVVEGSGISVFTNIHEDCPVKALRDEEGMKLDE